jgi:hypothetical protein
LGQTDIDWLEKPWVYTKPRGEEALFKWREKWAAFILDYAEQKNLYLVNTKDLKREIPFAKIDQEAFSDIIDYLIKANHAKWRSKSQFLLAICWRSMDKWAELAVEAAKEQGRNIIAGVEGLKETYPAIACLPQDMLEQVLKLIVEKKWGHIADKKTSAIRLA